MGVTGVCFRILPTVGMERRTADPTRRPDCFLEEAVLGRIMNADYKSGRALRAEGTPLVTPVASLRAFAQSITPALSLELTEFKMVKLRPREAQVNGRSERQALADSWWPRPAPPQPRTTQKCALWQRQGSP